MSVFLDTNVILEFFIEREDVRTAAQLLNTNQVTCHI